MKVPELAWPLAPVGTLMVLNELLKVPDAPVDGAVKLTAAPETRLPKASVTLTMSGFAKAVPTGADCPEPETMAIVLATPAVIVTVVEPQVVLPILAAMVGMAAVSSP